MTACFSSLSSIIQKIMCTRLLKSRGQTYRFSLYVHTNKIHIKWWNLASKFQQLGSLTLAKLLLPFSANKREWWGREWKSQSGPWDMWITPKLCWDQLNAWNSFEVSANFYPVFSRENSTGAIIIFCIVCFEALVCGLRVISNNLFNPLNPKIKTWILICCPYSFPTEVVGRSW